MKKAVGFVLLAVLTVSLLASHTLALPSVMYGERALSMFDRGSFYRHSTTSWLDFGDIVRPKYTWDSTLGEDADWVQGYWSLTSPQANPTLEASWTVITPQGHRGDEDVSIFRVQPDAPVFDLQSGEEVTGMISDLELLAYSMSDGSHYTPWTVVGTGVGTTNYVDMALGAYGRHDLTDEYGTIPDNAGGMLQLWFDSGLSSSDLLRTSLSSEYARSPTDVDGSLSGTDGILLTGNQSGTNMDTAGPFTDGTLLLAAALAPMPASETPFTETDHALNSLPGGAVILQTIDNFDVSDFGLPPDESESIADGLAFANVLSGEWAWTYPHGLVEPDYFGAGLDVELVFDLNTDKHENFQVGSDDPVTFNAIPEPATIGLFSLGIAGLVGLRRKKSKK